MRLRSLNKQKPTNKQTIQQTRDSTIEPSVLEAHVGLSSNHDEPDSGTLNSRPYIPHRRPKPTTLKVACYCRHEVGRAEGQVDPVPLQDDRLVSARSSKKRPVTGGR